MMTSKTRENFSAPTKRITPQLSSCGIADVEADVLGRPNEGNLDEARQQATTATVAAEQKALDVQRTQIISLLRLRSSAGGAPANGARSTPSVTV
jgi:hypothetical protein